MGVCEASPGPTAHEPEGSQGLLDDTMTTLSEVESALSFCKAPGSLECTICNSAAQVLVVVFFVCFLTWTKAAGSVFSHLQLLCSARTEGLGLLWLQVPGTTMRSQLTSSE